MALSSSKIVQQDGSVLLVFSRVSSPEVLSENNHKEVQNLLERAENYITNSVPPRLQDEMSE